MVSQSSLDPVHCGQPDTNFFKMDTSLMFQNILDYNAAKRVEVLIVMRKLLKTGNGDLPFHNISRNDVFDVLYHVLDDSRWEVRYQCLLLIAAIIPNGSEEIDSYMLLIIPKIILNLGHENVNVRRAALQVLHVYMKFTNNLQNFQKLFIIHGLENSEYIVRKGSIMSIGILFTSDFENENLFPLVECLSKHFVDGDASLFYPIFLAMQKINELLGNSTFDQYLQTLDVEAANTYKRVLNKFTMNSRMSSSSGSRSSFGNINGVVHNNTNKLLKFDFGIFQPYIAEKIKSDDWKIRVEALEHMKIIIRETPDFCDRISDMDEFMVFLSRLLEDSNFKIVIQTLSVYDLLIDKFKNQIRRFLKTFVTSVLKRLGDAKLVVREHAIRVIHRLMHHIRPTEVLGNLLQYKDSRNLRLREEIINRVTAAVLTFPSYNFEFHPLCEAVAPLIADTKRRVRLAALECFAALAQAMGPTRLVPLVAAVDSVEINCDADGLLSAVQARLARRILPRCTEDGVVSYAVTLPSSAGCQSRNTSPWGADIEWIMAASGSSSSSTPPSRSKEVLLSNTDLNDELCSQKLVSANKIKTEESENSFKRYSNWLSNSAFEIPDEANKEQVSGNEDADHHFLKINGSFKEDKVKPVIVSSPEKLTTALVASCEERKCHSENVKTRPVILSSKIPVLSRVSGKKTVSDEPDILAKQTPIRALSAQRYNTLPSFHVRYSATQRRSSNHSVQNARVQSMLIDRDNRDITLRKISPASSPLGRQPILVRSPSLNSLGQLHNDVNSTNQVLYGAYAPSKTMGNFGSYFRPSPDGVIVAQPAPVHLDDVNVFGVAVLDDSGKLSSTSADGWEMIHASSHGSIKDESWKKSVEGMPEVYEMHVDPPSYGRKVVTSPLNIVDNGNISIAKITREKMLKRQQEIMKEAEERRITKEKDHYIQQHFQDQLKNTKPESEISPDDNSNTIMKDNNVPEIQTEMKQEVSVQATSPIKPHTPPIKQIPVKIPQAVQQEKRIESAQRKGSAKPLSRSSSLKTPSTLRKFSQNQGSAKNSQTAKYSLAASSLALFDESSDEVATYPNPNEALKKALKSLSTDTWMGKIEGIRTIQRLAKCHPESILCQLHPVVLALLTEVKNLRSSVARAAILAVGDLFVSLKKNVEPDLDLITSTLLSKCGETVGFIREDIEKVMNHLIDTITPSKAALAIIAGGASHRNGAVRKVASQSLLSVVEKMGATRILTSAKEVTERLLPTTAQFLMDGTPLTRLLGCLKAHLDIPLPSLNHDFMVLLLINKWRRAAKNIKPLSDDVERITRWYGRRIYHLLMQHPSFDKLLLRYVQPSTLRNINSILDSIRKKGAGDMPKEGVSAKTLKSETYRNGLLSRTM